MSKPSWRLKFDRAEQHLADLKLLLDPVTDRQPHPVRESFDPDEDEPWIYHLDLGPRPNELAAILAGDCLFNIRSGLDHLAVAIAPTEREEIADFPILTKDPFVRDDRGKFLHERARTAWFRSTTGMDENAVAAFQELQPYVRALEHGANPNDHALAILAALQNADKHRKLVALVSGISKSAISARGETIYVVPILKDGTLLEASREKVDVEAVGAAHVAFGLGDEGAREFPRAFDTILDMVAQEIVPTLEPFARL